MSEDLSRDEMISMLQDLDRALKRPLKLVICGGSAAILGYGLKRKSMDIDILKSTLPLDTGEIKDSVAMIGRKYDKNAQWINDVAKKVFEYLPIQYAPETMETMETMETGFDKLTPAIITKADFVITKLAFYTHIRGRDIRDLKEVAFDKKDIASLFRKLNLLSKDSQGLALMIEAFFKEFRNDFVFSKEGSAFTALDEITRYYKERYGIDATEEELSLWELKLSEQVGSSSSIVAEIDRKMADRILSGDTLVSNKDLQYRREESWYANE